MSDIIVALLLPSIVTTGRTSVSAIVLAMGPFHFTGRRVSRHSPVRPSPRSPSILPIHTTIQNRAGGARQDFDELAY